MPTSLLLLGFLGLPTSGCPFFSLSPPLASQHQRTGLPHPPVSLENVKLLCYAGPSSPLFPGTLALNGLWKLGYQGLEPCTY